MSQREILLLGLVVDQHGVALVERAALGILTGQTHGIPFEDERAVGQQFGEAEVDRSLAVTHLGTLLVQLDDFRVHVKASRRANQPVGDFGELLPAEAGVHLKCRVVLAVVVGSPISRQFAEKWSLCELRGFALLLFVLFLDRFRDGRGIDSGVLCVQLPQRRMIPDALVEARLGDGGVVDLAVAVASVADQVDDYIGVKFGAVFGGEAADADNGVGILGIDVENRHALAARNARGVARGVLLRRARGEANQIVDNDVEGATHGIGSKVAEIEGFRPDTLAGKGGIAVHDDRPDLVQGLARAIDPRALDAVAGKLGTCAAHRHGVNRLEVARIRDQVHVERFAPRGGVNAGRADVILHVACSEHAAWIDVFEPGNHVMHGLRGDVGHHVQPAAVAHGHHGIDAAKFAGGIQNGIKQGDQRRFAFEREALAAEVAALQNLFEQVGANEALEDFRRVHLKLAAFHTLGDPSAPCGVRDVEKFSSDCAAIDAARLVGVFSRETLEVGTLKGREIAERVQ